MGTKVLITGACGFVGSNLALRLANSSNYELVGIDDLSQGNKDYVSGLDLKLCHSDIRDFDSILQEFEGVDTVIHLAAAGSVVQSVKDPLFNFSVNVQGTLNVLRACAHNRVKKVIFSSTGGALMGNTNPPVSESSLPKPISPYGASKLCCEAYCNAFASCYGLETICLRFANVYGPNSYHKSGVINTFFKKIKRNENLTIFGDGSSTRDYIHVDDLVSAILNAIHYPVSGNEIFHIATGREVSIVELGQLALNVSGAQDISLDFLPSRTGEVERNFADYEKARNKLSFRPKISIENGLKQLWDDHAHEF